MYYGPCVNIQLLKTFWEHMTASVHEKRLLL